MIQIRTNQRERHTCIGRELEGPKFMALCAVPVNLSTPSASCKWTHVVFILLRLICFAQHNIFKVLPCWMRCQNPLLFFFFKG